jgi:hypothetical protein
MRASYIYNLRNNVHEMCGNKQEGLKVRFFSKATKSVQNDHTKI